MQKTILTLLLAIGFATVQAQEIDKEFPQLAYFEEFEQSPQYWQQTNNGEDLFITQGGKYLLQRKNKNTPALILASLPRKFSAFQFEAVFNFEKNNNASQSVGFILMAQEEGTGALVVEVSQKQELRIMKYTNNTFRNLAVGTETGWIKVKALNPEGDNRIVIKALDRLYDIYINGVFVRTFTELEYQQGQIGFYIGAESKAAINEVKVLTDEEPGSGNTAVTNTTSLTSSEPAESTPMSKGDKALTDVILQLRAQNNNQKKDIAGLTRQLENCQKKNFADSTKKATSDYLKSQTSKLNAENKKLDTENDTLKKQVASLKKFKETVQKNESGDIVINLTNLLTDEQDANKKLTTQNRSLTQNNTELTAKNKNLEADKKRLEAELAKLKAEKNPPKPAPKTNTKPGAKPAAKPAAKPKTTQP